MDYSIEKHENGILFFTIEREERRNAINYDVMLGLQEAILLAGDPSIKALVITGSGEKAFCSGGDLSVFHTLETKEEAYFMLSKMSDILYDLLVLPKPTVALMNGHAVGGGCELAISCDYRLARRGTKAGFIQGKQAITTGWGGGSILAEKLSYSAAFPLLSEAEVKPAEYLTEIGFINELYDTDPRIALNAFLEKTVERNVNVLLAYKKIWINKWKASGLQQRIQEEVQTCSVLWESDAHHEYVFNFLNKKNE